MNKMVIDISILSYFLEKKKYLLLMFFIFYFKKPSIIQNILKQLLSFIYRSFSRTKRFPSYKPSKLFQ